MALSSSNGRTSSGQFTQQRLLRAVERVNVHWFPVNERLVNQVRNGLRDGSYDLDLDFLLQDLRSDFALLTFVCREVALAYGREGLKLPVVADPFQFLRIAGLMRIKTLFLATELRFSTHTLGSASPHQLARLREAMISASAVAVLSQGQSVDPQRGFSMALLRQFGLALVAWNYPSVYERAIEESDSERGLQSAVTEALGFSPALLGAAVVAQWGFLPEEEPLITGRVPVVADSGSGDPAQIAQRLMRLCEVGEALARAENPECNRSAAKDLEFGQRMVGELLGEQGMRLIEREVRTSCEQYRAAAPEAFQTTEHFDPQRRISGFREGQLCESNPYIRGCNPNLRRALKDLYPLIVPGTVSAPALKQLMNQVLPSAGFAGGCIYAYDPAHKVFMPRLKFGSFALRGLVPLRFSSPGTEAEIVTAAFTSPTPMIEHLASGSELDTARIAVGLGSREKVAVLSLEIAELALNEFELRVHHHLKAIRCAFEHALGELPT